MTIDRLPGQQPITITTTTTTPPGHKKRPPWAADFWPRGLDDDDDSGPEVLTLALDALGAPSF